MKRIFVRIQVNLLKLFKNLYICIQKNKTLQLLVSYNKKKKTRIYPIIMAW